MSFPSKELNLVGAWFSNLQVNSQLKRDVRKTRGLIRKEKILPSR